MTSPAIVWFRQDLRLTDNPALIAAAADGRTIVPVYIRDDAGAKDWAPGGASRWWLHHSLAALRAALLRRGVTLILREGATGAVLDALIAETGATSVFWNRCYEPFAIARDSTIKASLENRGIAARSFNASLLFEPWTVKNKSGAPYKVFTQFWKTCLSLPAPPAPVAAPRRLSGPDKMPRCDSLESWRLLPRHPDWAGGLLASWVPGEDGARRQLDQFLDRAIAGYKIERDRPDHAGTSRLSPYLHWGEIGPRQIWHAMQAASGGRGGASVERFMAELGWREFSTHLLYSAPHLPERPLRREFERFAWANKPSWLRAWQRGLTGYPIVDAGMRELWATGWMHNRVRMITASFLIKDLQQPWQAGAAWFWDTLVDADLANNSASWQWVAGCGADAAPYFRIFNPVLQGEKFDPQGAYVRRHVPELAELPNDVIHKPWMASSDVLANAGVTLGKTYPEPIGDHPAARERALAAYATLREDAS